MINANRLAATGVLIGLVTVMTAVGCRRNEPKLSVFQPAESSHFARGDTIHFASELNSQKDPGRIDQGAWRWVSDIDGDIGRGPRIDASNLSVGEHQVTASVRHNLGVSRARVTVFVDSTGTTK